MDRILLDSTAAAAGPVAHDAPCNLSHSAGWLEPLPEVPGGAQDDASAAKVSTSGRGPGQRYTGACLLGLRFVQRKLTLQAG